MGIPILLAITTKLTIYNKETYIHRSFLYSSKKLIIGAVENYCAYFSNLFHNKGVHHVFRNQRLH